MELTGVDPATAARVQRRFVSETGNAPPVERLVDLLADEAPLLAGSAARAVATEMAVDLVGLGSLQRLLADPSVSDVLVNGPGEVWVERSGSLQRSGVAIDAPTIDRCIERLVGPLGLRVDRSSPILDARLPDGTRVAVVLSPLAVDGPVVALRRHRTEPVALDRFTDARTAALLRRVVAERRNVVVHGPTGSGKTTLVATLLAEVGPDERIVTIEDVAELPVAGGHVVRLEARPGTAEGVGRAAVRDLVRAALRLRPDRLVVGEVRGAEALDMVWALSTGHDGSISTCHARGPGDALARLATFCLLAGEGLDAVAVGAQVAAAVDVLVGVARGSDGARQVTSVHSVDDDGAIRRLDRAT